MTRDQALSLRPVTHLRVNGRRRDRAMPEQSLDVPQIYPLIEQLRRQRVADHVGCDHSQPRHGQSAGTAQELLLKSAAAATLRERFRQDFESA